MLSMEYVIGTNRNQLEFTSLDMMVSEDSPVRVIDSFVEKTLKGKISLKYSERPAMGRPSYNPLTLVKLYLYGYMSGVKSSRKLARLVKVNIEAMWLVEGLKPDFRTISDFRKNNIEAIVAVFVKFREFCSTDLVKATGKNVFSGYKAIDGTKIRAVQAKDGVYTANKIDDRIANDNSRIAEIKNYLSELDANDYIENNEELKVKKDELEKALKAYEDREEKHINIRKTVEETVLYSYTEKLESGLSKSGLSKSGLSESGISQVLSVRFVMSDDTYSSAFKDTTNMKYTFKFTDKDKKSYYIESTDAKYDNDNNSTIVTVEWDLEMGSLFDDNWNNGNCTCTIYAKTVTNFIYSIGEIKINASGSIPTTVGHREPIKLEFL